MRSKLKPSTRARPLALAGGGLAALLIGAVFAAPAGAVTRVKTHAPDPRFGTAFGDLSVSGDRRANRIEVSGDSSGNFTVTDSKAKLKTKDKDCEKAGRHRVTCEADSRAEAFVSGNQGRDRVMVTGSIRFAQLVGEFGKDVLDGGDETDYLLGGRGNDVERGNGGNDTIGGGRYFVGEDPGRDTFLGGDGNDTVYADDHRADILIDCGLGDNDFVAFDAGQDPAPLGCELTE